MSEFISANILASIRKQGPLSSRPSPREESRVEIRVGDAANDTSRSDDRRSSGRMRVAREV